MCQRDPVWFFKSHLKRPRTLDTSIFIASKEEEFAISTHERTELMFIIIDGRPHILCWGPTTLILSCSIHIVCSNCGARLLASIIFTCGKAMNSVSTAQKDVV